MVDYKRDNPTIDTLNDFGLQGFNPEHRDIKLLKLRNYTVGRKIKDSDLTSSDAQEKIMAVITPMVEYVRDVQCLPCLWLTRHRSPF